MSAEQFEKKQDEAYKKLDSIMRQVENFRMTLGELEGIAQGGNMQNPKTETTEILSLGQHFIMNGLQNLLMAEKETLIRASYAFKRQHNIS